MEQDAATVDNGDHTGRKPITPFFRRHRKTIAILGALLLIVVGVAVAYGLYLNSSLKNIERFSINLNDDARPSAVKEGGTNILMLGADHGGGDIDAPGYDKSIAYWARQAKWPAGKYHSDAILLVHISPDRKDVSVVSLPRDSYVPIYDGKGGKHKKNKVNYALFQYGPAAALETIESYTDVRFDHMALFDWTGFRDITNALDGVEVYVTETVKSDHTPGLVFTKGKHTIKGDVALDYVRERVNLPRSDYSRIHRQQNVLRSISNKLISKGTLSNPVKSKHVLDALTRNMSLDQQWSASDIRKLAFSLRNVRPDDLRFVTLPIDGYGHLIDGIGSVVYPDKPLMRELFGAMHSNDIDTFIAKHPKQKLQDEKQVF